MDFKYIKVSKIGAVLEIRLNRPDVLNSFTIPMAMEFQAALDQAAADKTIRALLLTGEGRGFCAGQDLAEVIMENGPKVSEIVNKTYNPIITKIRQLEKPVVCGVNGVAAGAGANLAFACDITLAAESAIFIQAFSKIGLIPDAGGTFFLPRLIGSQKATALMMLAEKLPSAEAEKLGLIYKVVLDADLYTEALKVAQTLAEMPTVGLGLTKRAINRGMNNTLEEQLKLEAVLQEEASNSYDHKEGVKAFLEKRKPVFKGE